MDEPIKEINDAALPSQPGFVHLDVGGLAPGTDHRYAFIERRGGVAVGRSPIGRFRTAPRDNERRPLVLGAVSCTKNGRAFDTLARAAARRDLDALLLLGDTTYNDGAKTLADYHIRWAENLSTAAYRALRANVAVAATWDDHEVDNNWDAEKIDPGQLMNARQALFDNLPIRRQAPDAGRIWRALRYGETAELFVLDCRGERRPSTRRKPDAQYISRAQMDWLKSGLAASPALFKAVITSVPISSFPLAFQLGNDDRWEGYAAQRDELLISFSAANPGAS